MKIGFIVGKNDEYYIGDDLYDVTPKKYYINDGIHVDVAVAMTIKQSYPDVTVDIIFPKDISLQRLKKNNVNFILGYDCINQIVEDPYVKKFSGKKGYQLLKNIYSHKQSKIFPPIEFLEFIWDKEKYLKTFQRRKIPVTPTIVVSNFHIPKLLQMIQKNNWKQFIIKPIGGTVGIGVERFLLKECLQNPSLLSEYFDEHGSFYSKFLVQELIKGFQKYGEIKMFWIQNQYSYAVRTIDRGGDDYQVKMIRDKKTLEECKRIGEKTLEALPKIKVNGKVVKPALVRTDFTCCLDNKKHLPSNYFVNEVEHQDAGSYVNNENIKYPYVQVMADTYVKKAEELLSLGF